MEQTEQVAVKVYPIQGALFDLFFDEGWTDWTRVLVRPDKLHIVGGMRFRDKELLDGIHQQLVK